MNTDAETFVPPIEAPPPRRRLPLPRSPQTLAIVILVVLVLAGVVMVYKTKTDEIGDLRRQLQAMEAVQTAQSEVVSTSQRFLVLLTTYNAETLAKQREEVLKLAAGRFLTEYSTLTGTEFLNALKTAQADSSGRIVHIASVKVEGATATSLALVEVTTKNKDLRTPRVERNLIELTLVRSDEGWLIDAVSIIGTLA